MFIIIVYSTPTTPINPHNQEGFGENINTKLFSPGSNHTPSLPNFDVNISKEEDTRSIPLSLEEEEDESFTVELGIT